MTNDTNTINTINAINTEEPAWYEFSTGNGRHLYAWLDTEKDASLFADHLNKAREINLYNYRSLMPSDFRWIAAAVTNGNSFQLSAAECEAKADEWLQDVCVMTSKGLQECLAAVAEAIAEAKAVAEAEAEAQ